MGSYNVCETTHFETTEYLYWQCIKQNCLYIDTLLVSFFSTSVYDVCWTIKEGENWHVQLNIILKDLQSHLEVSWLYTKDLEMQSLKSLLELMLEACSYGIKGWSGKRISEINHYLPVDPWVQYVNNILQF